VGWSHRVTDGGETQRWAEGQGVGWSSANKKEQGGVVRREPLGLSKRVIISAGKGKYPGYYTGRVGRSHFIASQNK